MNQNKSKEISFGDLLSKSKESEQKVSVAKDSSAFKQMANVYEDDENQNEKIDDYYHSSKSSMANI